LLKGFPNWRIKSAELCGIGVLDTEGTRKICTGHRIFPLKNIELLFLSTPVFGIIAQYMEISQKQMSVFGRKNWIEILSGIRRSLNIMKLMAGTSLGSGSMNSKMTLKKQ